MTRWHRFHEWQEGHAKPGGRAEAARRLEEAKKLFEEVSTVLADVRQELLRSSRRPGQLYRIG